MISVRLKACFARLGTAFFFCLFLLTDAPAQDVPPAVNQVKPADISVYQEPIFPELRGNQLLDSLATHYRPQQILNYDDARDELYTFTDNLNGQLQCAYTGDLLALPVDAQNPRDLTNAGGWNAEHVWPQSMGASIGLAQSDLHHLRAVRGDVNSSRGNAPYAFIDASEVQLWWKDDVSQPQTPSGDTGEWSRRGTSSFQVRDAQQGDIARAMFYFYMTYPEEAVSANPAFFSSQAEVLRSYHNQDSIDASEVQRNTRTEMVQGNLNPFITDTTLVRRAFFEDFDPDEAWGPKGYFVDFEDGSKGSYAEGSVELAGTTWSFNNALIAGGSGDEFIGSQSARLRHQAANPAVISMSEDKTGGIGSISFLYAASRFGGDRSPELPSFVVEYSTDSGLSWQPAGSSVQLSDSDGFSIFSHALQLDDPARIRIRSTGGSDGRRFNIEDLQITDYSSISLPELAELNISEVRFTGFSAASEILDTGNSPITARGFIAAAAENNEDPFLGDDGITEVSGSRSHPDIFEGVFSALAPGKTYLVKAYASNASGTTYSETRQVTLSDTIILQETLRSGTRPPEWSATDISFETAAGGYARLDTEQARLLTPVFDATGFGGIRLQFDVAKWGSGGDGPVDLHYSLDAGETWVFAGSSAIPDGSTYIEEEQITVNEVSERMQLRFSRENSPSRKRLRNVVVMGAGEVFTAEIGTTPERQNSGYRLLAAPVETTVGALLYPLWTQGSPGADAPDGPPSVFLYDGTSYVPVDDFTRSLTPGEGLLVYVFEKDDPADESSRNWPKVLQAAGQIPEGAIDLGLQNTSGGAFNLIGNPFSTPVALSGFTRSNVQNQVFVFDHNFNGAFGPGESGSAGGGWRSWNGVAGSLDKGHIAPFQSFFVRIDEGVQNAPSLQIPESARVSSGELYDAPETGAALQIAGRINGRQVGEFWLSFSENSSSGSDVELLYPLEPESFLALFTESADRALNTKHFPLAPTTPLELPLFIEAWQPDAEAGRYVSMGGEVELIWPQQNLPESWSITLHDRHTGQSVDLRESEAYGFRLEPAGADEPSTLSSANLHEAPRVQPVGIEKKATARFMLEITPATTHEGGAQATVPETFSLHQNYPNPFNPGTRIEYELADRADVRLDVFNIQGQRVATLVNKQQGAGRHSTYFDASRLASGVYLYRLQSGNLSQVRRMTLVR